MNNKGFTLVEMLATVVILGAVMGIATYSVMSAVEKSREKSESIFITNLEKVIQSYISKNRFSWRSGDAIGSFDKCRRVNDDGTCYSADDRENKELYEVNGSSQSPLVNSTFNISVLANENYIQGGRVVNPKNKLNCLDGGKDPSVTLYKDEDSVFYYYVNLSGSNTSCDISDANSIVSNIPENMCVSLSSKGFSWNSTRKVCEK